MRISTPLTSRARKHKVVIQWVARTTAQCRGRTVVAGTAEAEVEPHTESAIYGIVPIGHTLCTRSGTPHDAASYSRALGYLAGHPGCVAGTHLPVHGDRHRGGGHPPPPATPPCVRVRTRRFETVTLAFLESGRNAGWFFGSSRRPGRLSPFPSRLSGCTRQRRREVQFDLGILLFVVLETHGLLASPSRSGLRPSFPAWPIHCSAFRHSECLTSLADVTT